MVWLRYAIDNRLRAPAMIRHFMAVNHAEETSLLDRLAPPDTWRESVSNLEHVIGFLGDVSFPKGWLSGWFTLTAEKAFALAPTGPSVQECLEEVALKAEAFMVDTAGVGVPGYKDLREALKRLKEAKKS